MLGARRHWLVAGTLVLSLSGLASAPARAQDAKLIADCAAPQRRRGAPPTPTTRRRARVTATVGCELRSTDAVAFKGVKATVKGRSESLEADFKGFDPRATPWSDWS